ncbi:kinase-like domain-containing protein [Gigaspora rosea]|uniref:Kinase-like domain-containing protein n=1 Tax=Gigaspora rosea TaxID=44941 RepID=A0A397W742_9GLOM|nr:kinase-like domain-containing protein [Gigaspora rosea]
MGTTLVCDDPTYGKCVHCDEYNMSEAWCQSCDPDIATRWTSRNKEIDEFIKKFQLKTVQYIEAIEWIPFDRLSDIKEIGKGEFGSVYSATWLDGIRRIEVKKGIQKFFCGKYIRSREPNSIIALKTMSGSLKEFGNHITCRMYGGQLKIYGLTRNRENEYLMVFQYADNGSLHKFLRNQFRDLNWQTKLDLLFDISFDLYNIHGAGYIHADFHSGNILQSKGIIKNTQSYITDLGLSKKENENESNRDIYGVLPYVAPEVLSGQKLTKAADVYGFGDIMSEISTGQRPFDGYEFDDKLAMKICGGLRPEFALGTPDYYIEFAKKCMDSNPENRPDADNIYRQLSIWKAIMENSDDQNDANDSVGLDYAKIKKQFLEADRAAKELPNTSPKHSDFMYTSKIINTQSISNAIKALPSYSIPSVEIPIGITNVKSHYKHIFVIHNMTILLLNPL